MAERLKVTVKTVKASHPELERDVEVHQVRVGTDSAEWVEEYSTQAEVDAFVRGARAIGSFLGVVHVGVEKI